VKPLTDLQISGCELHKNAFYGRAPYGPDWRATALPRPPSRYKGERRERRGRKRLGIGKGKKRKGRMRRGERERNRERRQGKERDGSTWIFVYGRQSV